MPEDVRIRPARTKDLREVTRLWRDLVGFHEALGGQDFRLAPGAEQGWQKYLRSHIGKPKRFCFVAEVDGMMVGFVLGSIESRPGVFMEREYGNLSDVYVRGPQRGKGVGRALFEAARTWFEDRRVGRIRLNTDARNTLGFEFWKKQGFQTTVLIMDRLL